MIRNGINHVFGFVAPYCANHDYSFQSLDVYKVVSLYTLHQEIDTNQLGSQFPRKRLLQHGFFKLFQIGKLLLIDRFQLFSFGGKGIELGDD